MSFPVAVSVGFKYEFDLVADTAKGVDLRFTFALSVWGIFEAPVVAIYHARESRADLVGIAADSNHGGNTSIEILI